MYCKPTTKKSIILLRTKQIYEKIVKTSMHQLSIALMQPFYAAKQADYSRILLNIFFSRFCPSFSSSIVALLRALRNV